MRVARRQLRVVPATHDAILGYLRDVVPPSALVPLDRSLRNALQHGRHDAGHQRRGHALPHDGGVGGRTTRAERRVRGRRRPALPHAQGDRHRQHGGADGAGADQPGPRLRRRTPRRRPARLPRPWVRTVVRVRDLARWPGAVAVASLVFSFICYVTPDVRQRGRGPELLDLEDVSVGDVHRDRAGRADVAPAQRQSAMPRDARRLSRTRPTSEGVRTRRPGYGSTPARTAAARTPRWPSSRAARRRGCVPCASSGVTTAARACARLGTPPDTIAPLTRTFRGLR
jgi:hypothetical protein